MTLPEFLHDIATSSPPRSGWYADRTGETEVYFRRDTVLVDGVRRQVLNLANLRTHEDDAPAVTEEVIEAALSVARDVPEVSGVLVSYADGSVLEAFQGLSGWRALPGRSMGPGSASFVRLVESERQPNESGPTRSAL